MKKHIGNTKGIEYRKKEELKRFFYPKQWIDFMNILPNDQLKFNYNFLMQTGARYNELKHVEVRDIDFERNAVKIRYAKARVGGMKKIKITCLNCNQKINLSKKLSFCHLCGNEIINKDEILKQYQDKIVERRREIRQPRISNTFKIELQKIIKQYKLNEKDIFPFYTIQHLRFIMHKYLKEIKFNNWEDMSPHNIRKTHENYLIATGSNVLSLRSHMGHSVDVAGAHYISNNLFTNEEISMIKIILDNLKV